MIWAFFKIYFAVAIAMFHLIFYSFHKKCPVFHKISCAFDLSGQTMFNYLLLGEFFCQSLKNLLFRPSRFCSGEYLFEFFLESFAFISYKFSKKKLLFSKNKFFCSITTNFIGPQVYWYTYLASSDQRFQMLIVHNVGMAPQCLIDAFQNPCCCFPVRMSLREIRTRNFFASMQFLDLQKLEIFTRMEAFLQIFIKVLSSRLKKAVSGARELSWVQSPKGSTWTIYLWRPLHPMVAGSYGLTFSKLTATSANLCKTNMGHIDHWNVLLFLPFEKS